MKRFEKICGILSIIAIIMKFALIPGADILMTISLITLSWFYFYPCLLFVASNKLYKKILVRYIVGSAGIAWGLSMLCCGILFIIQHFPGATMILLTGLVITIINLIIYFRSKSDFRKIILIRASVIGGFALFLFFASFFKIL